MDPNLAKPIADNVCILYDRTGEIVYKHQIVTIRGGRKIPDDELIARTHEQASAAGRYAADLNALTLPGDQYESSAQYRVDVVSKALVKVKP
jgi:hypothetical protein